MAACRKLRSLHEGERAAWGNTLRERLTLEIDVSARISHCGVELGVAHPLGNSGEVHARFEQGDCGDVSKRLRMDAFVAKGWRRTRGSSDVLAQQIPHPDPRELLSAGVRKERLTNVLIW
jgi:hypothetical protein